MTFTRSHLFIALSSAALLAVLVIQVSWILQSAKIKEEIFNEKAQMVLSKTANAIDADTLTFKKIVAGKGDVRKIDSLLNYYMRQYNIRIGYYFSLLPGHIENTMPNGPYSPNANIACYTACVGNETAAGGKARRGLELQLVFPGRDEFILEEMGLPFIASVILILIVLFTSWRSTLSLIKEKQISEHNTEFLNNMTHEFKTPLTNIALAGKMMVKDNNIHLEEKIKHYSGIILDENEKLRLQVEQVLSMSALERGEIPLIKTELDVHQLISEALKCISVQIENTQGHLSLQLDALNFVVIGDKTHLMNALCNLLDNAIKYANGQPELLVKTYNEGAMLMIEIADKGIGIDARYHKKIFDAYFRVPTGNVHNVKGFGLGLAYTKKIIELHGGLIALHSEKNKGTTFTISLPYA